MSYVRLDGEIKYDSVLSAKPYIRVWENFPLDLKLFADIKTTEQLEVEDMEVHGWQLDNNGVKIPLK